jgi:iron complex transport system substrate-binding protein
LSKLGLRDLAAEAALALPSLTACATGSTGAGPAADAAPEEAAATADALPVTVEHAFGSRTIRAKPERVATASWVNGDVALAPGVVTVPGPERAHA